MSWVAAPLVIAGLLGLLHDRAPQTSSTAHQPTPGCGSSLLHPVNTPPCQLAPASTHNEQTERIFAEVHYATPQATELHVRGEIRCGHRILAMHGAAVSQGSLRCFLPSMETP